MTVFFLFYIAVLKKLNEGKCAVCCYVSYDYGIDNDFRDLTLHLHGCFHNLLFDFIGVSVLNLSTTDLIPSAGGGA